MYNSQSHPNYRKIEKIHKLIFLLSLIYSKVSLIVSLYTLLYYKQIVYIFFFDICHITTISLV
jgi:hypothetical protein